MIKNIYCTLIFLLIACSYTNIYTNTPIAMKQLTYPEQLKVLNGTLKATFISAFVGSAVGLLFERLIFTSGKKEAARDCAILFGLIGLFLGGIVSHISLTKVRYNFLAQDINKVMTYPFMTIEGESDAFLHCINQHFIASSWPLVEAFEHIHLLYNSIKKDRNFLATVAFKNPDTSDECDVKNLLALADVWLKQLEQKMIVIKNNPLFYLQSQIKLIKIRAVYVYSKQ